MNVTMVGTTNSGKTAFMAGLYEDFINNNIEGFKIPILDQNNNTSPGIALGKWENVKITKGPGIRPEFPLGTLEKTLWRFRLKHDNQSDVFTFNWIDYRGGDLVSALQDSSEVRKFNDIFAHISSSNFVLLFADSVVITGNSELPNLREWSGATRIQEIFQAYEIQKRDEPLIFVIVLTKADAVETFWKENNYRKLVKRGAEVFSEMVDTCIRKPNWQGAIVPVSAVGEGNVRNRIVEPKADEAFFTPRKLDRDYVAIIGRPKPMNISNVLFYCTYKYLARVREHTRENIAVYKYQLEEAMKNSNSLTELLTWIQNNLLDLPNKKKTPSQIVEELKEELEKELRIYNETKEDIDRLYRLAKSGVHEIDSGFWGRYGGKPN